MILLPASCQACSNDSRTRRRLTTAPKDRVPGYVMVFVIVLFGSGCWIRTNCLRLMRPAWKPLHPPARIKGNLVRPPCQLKNSNFYDCRCKNNQTKENCHYGVLLLLLFFFLLGHASSLSLSENKQASTIQRYKQLCLLFPLNKAILCVWEDLRKL